MTLTPKPTQLSGAAFLASHHRALLADEPRVGKTGAAIIASDYVMATKILVLTTASGRAVWRAAFKTWSKFDRVVHLLAVDNPKTKAGADVHVGSWGSTAKTDRDYDLVILDEDHWVKSPDAQRTKVTFGAFYGDRLLTAKAIVQPHMRVWHLTGTPLPHDAGDTFVRLRASAPELLAENPAKNWPSVLSFEAFRKRYCVIKPKKISAYRSIQVVIGGRNLQELSERMAPFMLRRTQKDLGMQPPIYNLRHLLVSAKNRELCNGNTDSKKVLDAASAGSTKQLEMLLGPLRRITGRIKAQAVVEALRDEFAGGLDKIVLMFWHHDVGNLLFTELAEFKPLLVNGASTPKDRETAGRLFLTDPSYRIFIGQIKAAGEAIDLSAASVLWFVESSFTPSDMAQAAMRIVNSEQKRSSFVQVCTLEGTIDEPMQAALLRLWAAINEVHS